MPSRHAALLVTCLLIVVGTTVAAASDEPSPPPPDATASPSVPASPAASPGAAFFPLPEIVAVIPPDIPTVSLEPTSEPALEVGATIPFTLEHCGLLSPVDVDGSLWQSVGGVDALGGPLDSDDEIGELINATIGELTLVDVDAATFTTSMGSVIHLERAPGALDHPLCM
jgi:hypothetical protein